jgi:hypothetical protein
VILEQHAALVVTVDVAGHDMQAACGEREISHAGKTAVVANGGEHVDCGDPWQITIAEPLGDAGHGHDQRAPLCGDRPAQAEEGGAVGEELGPFDVDRLVTRRWAHVLRRVVSGLAERGADVRSGRQQLHVPLGQRVVDHPMQSVLQPGVADLELDRVAAERVDDPILAEPADELPLALQRPVLAAEV